VIRVFPMLGLLVLAGAVVAGGPGQSKASKHLVPHVRAITVKAYPADPARPLPPVSRELWDRLRADDVGLAVELEYRQPAVESAVRAIQAYYAEHNRQVRVEHEARQVSGGSSLEITFRVFERCHCPCQPDQRPGL